MVNHERELWKSFDRFSLDGATCLRNTVGGRADTRYEYRDKGPGDRGEPEFLVSAVVFGQLWQRQRPSDDRAQHNGEDGNTDHSDVFVRALDALVFRSRRSLANAAVFGAEGSAVVS